MEQKRFFSQIKGSQSLSFQKPFTFLQVEMLWERRRAKAHWEKNLM